MLSDMCIVMAFQDASINTLIKHGSSAFRDVEVRIWTCPAQLFAQVDSLCSIDYEHWLWYWWQS